MFKPKTISIVDSLRADLAIEDSPFYALLGDRYLRKCHEIEPSSVVRIFDLAYRLVERKPELAAGVYARPWSLWAVLRLRRRCLDRYWAAVDWLCHHGIIHLRTPEAMRIRWRDLGFGPDPRWKRGS